MVMYDTLPTNQCVSKLSQMDCKAAHAAFTVSAGLRISKKTAAMQSVYQNDLKQKALALLCYHIAAE